MAKSKSSASKPKKSALQMQVPGTKLVVDLIFKKLAKKTAGTAGIEYSNCCPEHHLNLSRKDNICAACGEDKPVPEDAILKQPKVARGVFLKPAWIKERKVKNDGRVTIVDFLDPEEIGFLSPIPELWRLSPGARAVLPATSDTSVVRRWAAFRQLLCDIDGAPARGAHIRFVTGTTSKRTIQGIVYPLRGQGLAFQECFRREDCYDVEWPTATLSAQEIAGFAAKGAELTKGTRFNFAELDRDPYRESMEQLFADLQDGKTPPEVPEEHLPEAETPEDLTALI